MLSKIRPILRVYLMILNPDYRYFYFYYGYWKPAAVGGA